MAATEPQPKRADQIQAELWGESARDWAEVMEGWSGWGVPLYRHVLERIPVGPGSDVLDVGCGAGRYCRMAADRGARCSGIDATPAFAEIARERVPGADIRVGDMQDLPWEDDAFDLVTGFNSFFIAPDMGLALRESKRVSRPGAGFAMSVFGRPERCDSTTLFAALTPFLPGHGGGDGDGPALHEDGVLDRALTGAGLEPVESGYLEIAEDYPDVETLLRGFTAAPPSVRAIRAAGREEVEAALTEAVKPFRRESGRYRLEEELRVVFGTA